MSEPGRLAEVSETAATGAAAALYDDIRRVTGVRSIALVHRALAAIPGALETIWADLAPNLADHRVRSAAARIAGAESAAVAPLDPGLVTVPLPAAAATLAGFARINRLNLVGLSALQTGLAAPPAQERGATATDVIPDGLPMAELASLPVSTLALLEEMSAPVAGAERPIVIPSLYRFFARDERLLRALWEALRPVVDDPGFEARVDGIRQGATALARALPYGVRPAPGDEAQAVVARFLRTIPSMIVVGDLLGQALGVADRS